MKRLKCIFGFHHIVLPSYTKISNGPWYYEERCKYCDYHKKIQKDPPPQPSWKDLIRLLEKVSRELDDIGKF